MTYFLLAVALLFCTFNSPQSLGATATLSVSITPAIAPGETYANAWAAAGSPSIVNQPCDGARGLKNGVSSTTGSLVECPPGASTGSRKSPMPPPANGDTATAGAWAKISAGVGTASAPVNIPSKPQVFAGAAAYAKANSSIPTEARGALKKGGTIKIIYGNLTVNGWSEPVDHLTLIMVDDLGPKQIPAILANVLDEGSTKSLIEKGFTFAQPKRTYFSIPMVLQGNKGAKVKVGKPFYFHDSLQKCPKNYDREPFEACLISEQSPSEKDFTPCGMLLSLPSKPGPGFVQHIAMSEAGRCRPDELKHSLDRMFTVELYIPGEDLSENVSVHEISCVKSRRPHEPPPKKDDDICSLLLHHPLEQGSGK